MSRRQFIRAATILAGSAMVVGGLGDIIATPRTAQATSSTSVSIRTGSSSGSNTSSQLPQFSKDYKDFLDWLGSVSRSVAGKRLQISLESEFMPLAVQHRDTDFTGVTGITDGYNLQPYAQQLSAIQLMTATKSTAYDVFSVDNQNVGIFNQHVISPLDLAAKYPEITYPNLDYGDFDPVVWNNEARYPPAMSGASGGNSSSNVFLMPFDTPIMVFFYRKDIYESLGLSPPNTWDEYFEDAKTLTHSSNVSFGAVSEAAPGISIVYEFTTHLQSFGGSLWDVNQNQITPAMDSDAAIAALENFVRFYPYSDVGSSSYIWTDVFNSLQHGLSACGLLWHDYAGWLNDPARSIEAGKFAFKEPPAGPKGSFSTFGGAGVGVSKYSRNPDAAWLWLQWATARGTEEALLLDTYRILPARRSAIESPEVQAALQGSSYASTKLAYEMYNTGRVVTLLSFPQWFKALDIISKHLSSAWLGQETPRDSMNLARQEVEKLGPLTF